MSVLRRLWPLILFLSCATASDPVKVQIVTGTFTILGLIVSAGLNKLWVNRQTKKLEHGQQGIHDLVDGTAASLKQEIKAQKETIDALLAELTRRNQPGAAPTPTAEPGEGKPGQVTQKEGTLTVEPLVKEGRRHDDEVAGSE